MAKGITVNTPGGPIEASQIVVTGAGVSASQLGPDAALLSIAAAANGATGPVGATGPTGVGSSSTIRVQTGPTGAPSGTELPLAYSNTGATGAKGLYYWNGTSWNLAANSN